MNKDTEKLYLTKEEFLENPIIREVDKDNNIKDKRIRFTKDENPRENKVKEEITIKKAFFPKELAAGFWIRFFAFTFDSLIAGAIVKIILGFANLDLSPKSTALITSIIISLYFTITNLINNGQSLGKMLFGLRVVRLDGKKLDFTTIFIREFVGRFIHSYSILSLLYVITAFTEYKQNLSDLFADTSVIQISKEEIYEGLIN